MAVYETTLVPPGGTRVAGIAWMDTRLLVARLYSGSLSPGGGPYRYTAPIRPAQAATLVAAFNGGFKMRDARGGYYTEGRTVVPLVQGAASLVIYANGDVGLGAWGTDVTMTHAVVSVRQNLVPLVANSGQPRGSPPAPGGSGARPAVRPRAVTACPASSTSGAPGLASPPTALWSTRPGRPWTRCNWPSS